MKTLQEIIDSDQVFLTPEDVSGVLKAHPHSIRTAAKQRPELLGFEFFFIGTRMKIPRIPFLRYLGVNL